MGEADLKLRTRTSISSCIVKRNEEMEKARSGENFVLNARNIHMFDC